MNQTAICNLALLRIGIATPIADITENSTTARACNAVWEQSIRTMLRERPWPFAVRQVDLALEDEGVFSDWAYTYRYPSDYINVHRVTPLLQSAASATTVVVADRTPYPQTFPFAIGSDASGKLIHTDVAEAYCVGTVYISDTSQFDPLFTSALAWLISAEIALSLTKSRELYANSKAQYDMIVSEAAATGLNEPKPRASDDADMIAART